MAMSGYPTGTVTFLFTDIERSTTLWERDAAAARVVVARHIAIIRQAVAAHGGVHYKTVGDATQSAFATAPQGVTAALDAQRGLVVEPWSSPDDRPRVRMALHAGAAEPRDGDYLAGCLNRLARLLDAAHGEQILVSHTVAGLIHDELPAGASLDALGEFRLRDILQPEAIFQLRHPTLRADFPPLNTPGDIPHNLPAHPTPFLGREREIEEIAALLQRPDVRLVTLTGPGGVGKTRLGLQVAAEALESFSDGTFVVDLARLTDPELIPSATATALGLREQPGQPLTTTLAEYLRDRRILLLFDNFEHVLPAATLAADLLLAAPHLKVLATSRARLGLQAEREYRVETLPIPDPRALPPLEQLSRYDAIALFVARAQALRPGFALTRNNAQAVGEIVCKLDGLPLAIELAAARIKLLSPEALRDRLDRRLVTLTGGARDLPARQRTLRDTIAWSHDLLAPGEQVLLRRLSVFAGGWTLEGAEAVSAVDGVEAIDPLQGLSGLVDQSLVDERPRPRAGDDEVRYGMLETIREFAGERLSASGEAAMVRHAFEAYLIDRAQAAEVGLQGPDQLRWLDRLEAEHANIRAALGGALERGDSDIALDLASRLWEFWRTRGFLGEGSAWLKRALALADGSSRERRAAAEFGLGRLAIDLDEYDVAATHIQTSAALWMELGDRASHADALNTLAIIKLNLGAFREGEALGNEALAISREIGDERGAAAALLNLGMLAREDGQLQRAIELLDSAMTMWRTLGDPKRIALAALNLGITQQLAGNLEAAENLLSESGALYEQIGYRYQLAVIAKNRGHLERVAGRPAAANHLFADAMRQFHDVGAAEGVIESIEGVAATSAASGMVLPPLRLFGATTALRQALRLPLLAHDAGVVSAAVEAATRTAGKDAADEALAIGAAWTLDQARDAALALALAAQPPEGTG